LIVHQVHQLATITLEKALPKAGLPTSAIRLQTGDCVLEWLPVGQSKGHAVRQLLAIMRGGLPADQMPLTPVVLGDDTTDEAAFEVARTLGGFGVRVGQWQGETHATYGLPNCTAVHTFLADLLV
jgi:trehalose 6-phosphate phosphatase